MEDMGADGWGGAAEHLSGRLMRCALRAGATWRLGATHGAVERPIPVLGKVVLDLVLGARGRPGQPIVKCHNGSRKHF